MLHKQVYTKAQKDSGVRGYIVVAVVVTGTRNDHNRINTTVHDPRVRP
jgi:hypothetical protein